jgi:hypothetical protein
MTDTAETRTRSEAPIASLVLGAIGLIAGLIATTPGISLIAGLVAVLTGAYALRRGQNWMAIAGITAAVLGILISVLRYAA